MPIEIPFRLPAVKKLANYRTLAYLQGLPALVHRLCDSVHGTQLICSIKGPIKTVGMRYLLMHIYVSRKQRACTQKLYHN